MHHVTVLDKLTYAGNPANIADWQTNARFRLRAGRHRRRRPRRAAGRRMDAVVNFAAETHVDRSNPARGVHRDRCARAPSCCSRRRGGTSARYLQVSTDEVYGTCRRARRWRTTGRPAQPLCGQQGWRRPAGLAYRDTYDLPVNMTRGVEQLRPVPVPREGGAALRHERHRRPAAADLRGRAADSGLALRQ